MTSSELGNWLALYQSLTTIVTFFAGFVFVTNPVVIFSADVTCLYGRFILYFLLASLTIFTILLDLYHTSVLQVYVETSPKIWRVVGKYKRLGIADILMAPAQFFAYAAISFMLLLEGLTIDAIIWFLVIIGRVVISAYIMFGWQVKK